MMLKSFKGVCYVETSCLQPSQLYRAQNSVFVRRPFGALSALNTDKESEYFLVLN